MNGIPQRQLATQATLVRVRLRWLASLPVVLIWACSGGSSAPGDPPGPPSTGPSPDPPPPVATSVAISPDSARLGGIGDTVQITFEVRDQNGNVMPDVMAAWFSDAPAVATVNATGLVTAVGDGTATVTASAGELSASAAVTVELPPPPPPPPPVATSLTISPATARLEDVGATVQFTFEVRDQNGDVMPDVSVAWFSDAPAVATVNAMGLVTAVGDGRAKITVATGDLSVSATVTVELPSAGACPGSACDREALAALHESTDGENWVNSANWLSDRPLSEWYGVYLDHDGRVIAIGLFSNGLSGSIPPEIGKLDALTDLALSSNDLSGSLPAELGNLGNLRELSVLNNRLSGPIPRELGTLGRLELIDVSGNRFSGPIPPELGALSRLIALRAWDNELSGRIPPELGNLSGLAELHLTDNRLSGTVPPELTRLPLDVFWWVGNPGLCMPDTAAFAAWVDGIGNYAGGPLCNQSDRTILDALYEATGGAGWTNTDGWPDGAIVSRHGIQADADGRVTAIDLSGNGLAGELPLALGCAAGGGLRRCRRVRAPG